MNLCKPLFDSFIDIHINFHKEKLDKVQTKHYKRAIDAAFLEMERIENLMTYFDHRSDISIINQTVSLNKLHPISIHPLTYEVLQIAKLIAQLTNGAFNCGVEHSLNRWGIEKGMDNFEELIRNHSINNLEFLENSKVMVHRPVLLDLSGISKGFAIERAINILKMWGIKNALISEGGNLKILGKVPRSVILKNINKKVDVEALLKIPNSAVVSAFSLIVSQKKYQQLYVTDAPIESYPIIGEKIYSVVASNCLVADALSKALAVDKRPKAAYFKKFGAIANIAVEKYPS